MGRPFRRQGVTVQPRDERLFTAGTIVLTAGVVIAGMSWLVRRQLTSGDLLRVQVVHSTDETLKGQIDDLSATFHKYLPPVRKIADQGIDLDLL